MHNPFPTRARKYFTGLVIFLLILIFYKRLKVHKNRDIVCHYSDKDDALLAAEDPRYSPKTKSIFFHETSCRGGLTARQACSVESAARAHPQWQIYVLFSSPVTDYALKTSCLAKLLQFNNVKFLRVHIAEYSKGNVIQSILLNDLKESIFPIQHSADILRILTLNKWGGIYLDTDMIVTRSLEQLPSNFVAKEDNVNVASGILAFAKDEIGTNVTNTIINELHDAFFPELWSANGAEVIHGVIEDMCPKVVKSVFYRSKPITNCKGVFIFDYDLFYPYYYTESNEIFNPPPEYFDLERPYTYHMWSYLTSNTKIHKGTVYQIVAKQFCPTIHDTYPDEFAAKEEDLMKVQGLGVEKKKIRDLEAARKVRSTREYRHGRFHRLRA